MNRALVVLRVPGLSHHHIVDLLLWASGARWIVAYMICLVSSALLLQNVGSVEPSALGKLACLVGMSLRSSWNLALHEGIFLFDVNLGLLVAADVNVSDWILGHEGSKWSQRIHT